MYGRICIVKQLMCKKTKKLIKSYSRHLNSNNCYHNNYNYCNNYL